MEPVFVGPVLKGQGHCGIMLLSVVVGVGNSNANFVGGRGQFPWPLRHKNMFLYQVMGLQTEVPTEHLWQFGPQP